METEATVVEEHVPEIKWPERIIVWMPAPGMAWNMSATDIDGVAEIVRERKMPYRILRVTPPVERRVVIDWEGLVSWLRGCGYDGIAKTLQSNDRIRDIIERHATIKEGTR